MSDAETPDDTTEAQPDHPGIPDEEIPPADGFDPVAVFPEGEFDLRHGADDCYKCSTCDTTCPVAEVEDEFPGPKFQGPEQWRLKRKDDQDIDPSVTDCSNCMRCDNACPTGVPLSQMHNEARGEYVTNQMSRLSRTYWRNRLLANYRTVAWLASKVPRLSNFVLNNRLTRTVNEYLLGVTSERDFPSFATETFRSWYHERGGLEASRERARQARERRGEAAGAQRRGDVGEGEQRGDAGEGKDKDQREDGEGSETGTRKRVAYFHGCYANYNSPEVAKAMVRVYETLGYEVAVPKQKCSGTPMFANGMLSDARRDAETNVTNLAALIDDGYDVICSCTSCSMALGEEYPELFDIDDIDRVATHTYEALEYLRIHEDLRSELQESSVEDPELARAFAYHAPCHARNQGLDRQAVELFRELDGVDVEDVGDSCSGISGTYGWKAEKYETSMEIGAEMFEEMSHAEGDVGMTECPTCASQMEHGTGYEIRHPLEVLEAALVDSE